MNPAVESDLMLNGEITTPLETLTQNQKPALDATGLSKFLALWGDKKCMLTPMDYLYQANAIYHMKFNWHWCNELGYEAIRARSRKVSIKHNGQEHAGEFTVQIMQDIIGRVPNMPDRVEFKPDEKPCTVILTKGGSHCSCAQRAASKQQTHWCPHKALVRLQYQLDAQPLVEKYAPKNLLKRKKHPDT